MTLTHTYRYRLRNETGFHERVAAQADSMKSCLSKEETAAWIELSLEWKSFLPLCENGQISLSLAFILSNVNLSFLFHTKAGAEREASGDKCTPFKEHRAHHPQDSTPTQAFPILSF